MHEYLNRRAGNRRGTYAPASSRPQSAVAWAAISAARSLPPPILAVTHGARLGARAERSVAVDRRYPVDRTFTV